MGSTVSSSGSSSPSGILTASNLNFTFSSQAGLSLCSLIIQKHAPYIPHDYILGGVAASLDRKDLIAVAPTGAGKTGFMAFLAVVAKELVENPVGYPEVPRPLMKWLPKHPLMLVVCPTDYMKYQWEQNFSLLGLKALVINATTTHAANEAALPVPWRQAQADNPLSALLLSPEQLQCKEFENALRNSRFRAQIFAVSVDIAPSILTKKQSWSLKFDLGD